MEKKNYPIGSQFYKLYEELGQGVSATVRRALCIPFNEIVAIKILDFERNNSDLNNISREAQTMVLVDHPNVLKSHCSFVCDHNLWVVMPLMAGGSCLHILKAAYPNGFEEVVIATILHEVLKGLEYLHHHGHIHRDVKAGNILIDGRGAIKLGDFGVSACLFDSGNRQRTRNTFVGTPCWMAPEVLEQLHGYDFKADIWSFGITALELAHGHAPFSEYPPMKVLLMTLQNVPPFLDLESDRKFSKSFKQMIASCLVKDPVMRPMAKKLLKHSFFKQARSNDYIARTLLDGLPTLGDRLKAIKRKEEDMVAQKKMPDGQKEELSQNEYKRGISGWNFNVEYMKAQASAIHDLDETMNDKDQRGSSSFLSAIDVHEKSLQAQGSYMVQFPEAADTNQPAHLPSFDSTMNNTKCKSDKSDDDMSAARSSRELYFLQNSLPCHDDRIETIFSEKPVTVRETNSRLLEGTGINSHQSRAESGGSISFHEVMSPLVKIESDKLPNLIPNMINCDEAIVPQAADDVPCENLSRAASKSAAAGNSDEIDERGKIPVVQQKGRFKVTSENVDLEKVHSPSLQKSQSMQVITQHPAVSLPPPCDATPSNLLGPTLLTMLHSVLQTNMLQRDSILSLMKQVSVGDTTAIRSVDGGCMPVHTTVTERSLEMLDADHDREKELLSEVSELQWRLICAQDELQKIKTTKA